MMPNLAGVDLCRRIRAANLERYIYVILCTAKGEKSDLIEGMDAGADDFLVKPIRAEELRVKVRPVNGFWVWSSVFSIRIVI